VTGEAGYLAFLREHDGEADLAGHTLSRREARHAGLAATRLRARRVVDAATFARNLTRTHPEPGLDDLTLWLLATAKANQAERFAVGLAELYGQLDTGDPVRVHTTLQEVYHTRTLAGVVALFGLPLAPRPPARVVRAFIRALLALPEHWQLPLAGAGEMAGCVLFRALRDRGVALLADEPAVAARVRLLFDEILADEIGHVGAIAARLGPGGRRLMRGLYRLLGHRLVASMPELRALYGRKTLAALFGRAFRMDEMLAAVGGAAYASAAV
jgi:hypothetical protein